MPDRMAESKAAYDKLLHDSALLTTQLQTVGEHQKSMESKTLKLASWLTSAELRLHNLSTSADKILELAHLLETVKVLAAETIGKDADMADVTSAAQSCAEAMKAVNACAEDTLVPLTKAQQMYKRLQDLHSDIADLANKLQLAVVQSQGVHDGLDNMLAWAKSIDKTLAGLKPISVNPAVLSDQRQEIGVLKTDIDSHVPGLDLLKSSVAEIAASGKNKDSIKAEELKLQKLESELKAIVNKAESRDRDLKQVGDTLDDFVKKSKKFQEWIGIAEDKLEMKDLPKTDASPSLDCLQSIKGEIDQKEKDVNSLQQLSENLINDPCTGDHSFVRDSVSQINKYWADLLNLLSDKSREIEEMKDSEDKYKAARDAMMQWLDDSEGRLQSLESAGGDVESLRQLVEELTRLDDEVDKQQEQLDTLNELGQLLDSLQHPELLASPSRRSK